MDDDGDRLGHAEGRLEEHGIMLIELRAELATLTQRMGLLEQRMDRLEQRLDRVDERMTRFFMWPVGLQVTTLTAVVVALAAR